MKAGTTKPVCGSLVRTSVGLNEIGQRPGSESRVAPSLGNQNRSKRTDDHASQNVHYGTSQSGRPRRPKPRPRPRFMSVTNTTRPELERVVKGAPARGQCWGRHNDDDWITDLKLENDDIASSNKSRFSREMNAANERAWQLTDRSGLNSISVKPAHSSRSEIHSL